MYMCIYAYSFINYINNARDFSDYRVDVPL